jgi:hypothetical protein
MAGFWISAVTARAAEGEVSGALAPKRKPTLFFLRLTTAGIDGASLSLSMYKEGAAAILRASWSFASISSCRRSSFASTA